MECFESSTQFNSDNAKPYCTERSTMGILSWFSRGTTNNPKKEQPAPAKPETAEAAGMNGAVEVRRPNAADISVFEFGSVAASADKVTLAGYCPVSDELEPCRWEILPASGSDAPQFRVVF
ncbi:allyl alcohol dehydrogenase-like protein [Perilla frutescens var. hirtella]|nr:allyl alcohol dehydrogenase-like protein [Perilla frutescens var. hirtella]KAH6810695.1 allyl alcohol dehydrogenase-like protein [Perilla frutescens var. frutescens]